MLIDDEKLCANVREGSVRFGIICDLIACSRPEDECAAVCEFGVELAFGAQEYVALNTPVIGEIAGRVLDHTHPDIAEILCAPGSQASFALVFRWLYLRPVSDPEGDSRYVHFFLSEFMSDLTAMMVLRLSKICFRTTQRYSFLYVSGSIRQTFPFRSTVASP